MQFARPSLGIPGRSYHNGHLLIHNYLHHLVHFRVEEWYIYAERTCCRLLALLDMLKESLGVHGAGSDEPKPSGITYRGCQTPTATPNHSSRYDRLLYPEERGESICFCHYTILL